MYTSHSVLPKYCRAPSFRNRPSRPSVRHVHHVQYAQYVQHVWPVQPAQYVQPVWCVRHVWYRSGTSRVIGPSRQSGTSSMSGTSRVYDAFRTSGTSNAIPVSASPSQFDAHINEFPSRWMPKVLTKLLWCTRGTIRKFQIAFRPMAGSSPDTPSQTHDFSPLSVVGRTGNFTIVCVVSGAMQGPFKRVPQCTQSPTRRNYPSVHLPECHSSSHPLGPYPA